MNQTQMIKITKMNKDYIKKREQIMVSILAKLKKQRLAMNKKEFNLSTWTSERAKINREQNRRINLLEKWYENSRKNILR